MSMMKWGASGRVALNVKGIRYLAFVASVGGVRSAHAEGHIDGTIGVGMGGTADYQRPAELIAPSLALGGFYTNRWGRVPYRLGLEFKGVHSSLRDWAIEGDIFFTIAPVYLVLDHLRSASVYLRVDAGVRHYFAVEQSPSYLGLGSIGVHLLGINTQFGAGPIYEPGYLADGFSFRPGPYSCGWAFESRIFFDMVELYETLKETL